VAKEWRQATGRLGLGVGDVIGCPPAGRQGRFQIAAGPERIGGDLYACSYFSLFNGDGSDLCSSPGLDLTADSLARPLMAVRAGRAGPLALVGFAGRHVASVGLNGGNRDDDRWTYRVAAAQAAQLGASRPFSYWSLKVDRGALCDVGARLVVRARSGRVEEEPVPLSTGFLDTKGRATYARPLRSLCGSRMIAAGLDDEWWANLGEKLGSLVPRLGVA
jgi:hypothetical protein